MEDDFPDDVTVKSFDDIASEHSQVVTELVLSPEPVSAGDVSERTGVDADIVSDVASTLIHAGYLLTDSEVPRMDTTAMFWPDPLVEKAEERSRTFRAADSREEIQTAIERHEEEIKSLRSTTGMDSADEYNNAVFDSDNNAVAESDATQERAMRWIMTERQLERLHTVEESYAEIEEEFAAVEDVHDFTPASVNPPEISKRDYLHPPEEGRY